MGRFSLGAALLGARRARTAPSGPSASRPSTIGVASVLDLWCTEGGAGGTAPADASGADPSREHLVRLRIEGDGREPSVLALRVRLTPAELSALVPGVPFPVRFGPGGGDFPELVDAADPLVRELLLRRRIALGLIPPEVAAARLHGVLAPARVIRSQPTGTSLDDQVEIAVSVRVQPSGVRTPWDADTRAFLHPGSLRHLVPGRRIAVRYLPGDPFVVAITLEDPRAESPSAENPRAGGR
ncbi:hypothetical protein Bra3105_00945 [Brachybacterium halotolerans subsp. kimchii]|uniref:hypothetical protein n=1 Tax=Brachybacterium halotolerans TaxID=2795215 RepID=UPI001E3E0CF9|nr:hypothetical protein [Brachybacterium halotolerans]UEJ82933.1 hypothetical protein Bra3105_00945 [Brachybacterium halotolerans subsp. kimchii]